MVIIYLKKKLGYLSASEINMEVNVIDLVIQDIILILEVKNQTI